MPPKKKRVDPDDGVAYTWGEFVTFYKGKFEKKAIEDYWEYTCTPKNRKSGGKAKAESEKKQSSDKNDEKPGAKKRYTKKKIPQNNAHESLKAESVDTGIDFKGKDEHWPDVRTRKCGFLDRTQALMASQYLGQFIAGLPKAELHVHLEGTLTPSSAYRIAKRNQLPNIKDFDPAKGAQARKGYKEGMDILVYAPGENALNAFLTEYNRCSGVYFTEEDFYDVMMDYLKRAKENAVRRAEIFFDPQTHCFEDVSGSAADPATRDPHGVGKTKLPFETVINGLWRAMEEGRAKLGVDSALILSFLQDRSTEEAMAMLDMALPYKDKFIGVGQDNGTGPFGPGSTGRFKEVYDKARNAGLKCVAHAGEEEGASNVEMCLDVLRIERVDHGVRCLEDPKVVDRLVKSQIALTCCPISNHRMQLYPRFFCGENPLRALLERGVKVTINSDDPAYFSLGEVDQDRRAINQDAYDGYINSNYLWTARTCSLTPDECVIIAKNSLEGSFAPPEKIEKYIQELKEYCGTWKPV